MAEDIDAANLDMSPLSLDSGMFDSEAALNSLLTGAPLAELLDTETRLGKEIRSLDSEMQTLVYENYNKFIAATDTVRNVRIYYQISQRLYEMAAETFYCN